MDSPQFRLDSSGVPPECPVESRRPARAPLLLGLFILACLAVLHVAREFFIPLALALLLTLILLPAVRLLSRWRMPSALGAIIVLLAFVGTLGLTGFLLAAPVRFWAQRSPEVIQQLSSKFAPVTRPLHHFRAQVENSAPAPTDGSAPLRVKVQNSDLLTKLASRTGNLVAIGGTSFILLYFLLATGEGLLRSCLAEASSLKQKHELVLIGHEIQHHISKYLLAITAINVGEGILLAVGLGSAGMPTPALWGALHAVLNFIPYIGSITGLAITAAVSFISFPTIPRALVAPGIYLAIMALDNFASPMVLGKRLVLNPALVFLALMLWGWIWGLVGVLVAVPLLVVLKIVCDHAPGLRGYGRIISGSSESASLAIPELETHPQQNH